MQYVIDTIRKYCVSHLISRAEIILLDVDFDLIGTATYRFQLAVAHCLNQAFATRH